MNSFSDLFAKLENAGKALLLSKQPTINAACGQDAGVKEPPIVVIYAESAGEEDPPHTGNFWASFQIQVECMAPTDVDGVDMRIARDLLVSQTFDVFMSSTLAPDLSAAGIADFTAIGVRARNLGFHTAGDVWINILTMQVLCCGSTLSP